MKGTKGQRVINGELVHELKTKFCRDSASMLLHLTENGAPKEP